MASGKHLSKQNNKGVTLVLSYLIKMDQKGDIAAKIGSQFSIFCGQQEPFWRSDGALLFYSCVHLLHSFGAVVQHHFTVSLETKGQQLDLKLTCTQDKQMGFHRILFIYIQKYIVHTLCC